MDREHQSNQSTIHINQGTKILKEEKKTNLIFKNSFLNQFNY
jgi:hypothetical protein